MSPESQMDGDMSELHGLFFDEAGEHLDAMETLLLGIDIANANDEQLNAIFRAAHSIKGGAATFGFGNITSLTHEMETTFDKVRKKHMALSKDLVDVFLASGDMLKDMLAALKGEGAEPAEAHVQALCERLRAFLEPAATVTTPQAAVSPAAVVSPAPSALAGKQIWELVFGPLGEGFSSKEIDGVVADLKDFGAAQEVTTPEQKQAGQERRFIIETEVSASDLSDAIAFMADPAFVKVRAPVSTPMPRDSAAPAVRAAMPPRAEDTDFGLFVDAATLPVNQPAPDTKIAVNAATQKVVDLKHPAKQNAAASGESASIRVSVEKVDQLINLVGELVITQAMLAQTASKADPVLYESLLNGLATLERNTRDLQEASMSIRMMPMSMAFSRFPRVVRDTATKLGKEVELVTSGEGTEIDKGLIERIVDPLTHLVRNSLDHGLEPPDERVAKGKVRKGTISLRAYHQGGAIVIEVADDGRGLRREKILAKAKERGMPVSDGMSDAEVWQLIFEAGFSTADVVTDVSGRGVGMDVVRRNIQELGGRVEIQSSVDIGTRISIKLPLTLAILDGMSVRVGREIFIVPLAYISESLQPEKSALRRVTGRGLVVTVRGDYLPVLSLAEAFNLKADKTRPEEGILVILENECRKTAMFVDELVGQHQVVIKSLETNYHKVPGISGATIMGDGRVAMIVDAAHIVGMAHSRQELAA